MLNIKNTDKIEVTRVFLEDTDYYLEIEGTDEDLWRVWLCNTKCSFKFSMWGHSKKIYSLQDMINHAVDGDDEDLIKRNIKEYNRRFFNIEE